MTGKKKLWATSLLVLLCGFYLLDPSCCCNSMEKREQTTEGGGVVVIQTETIDRLLLYKRWIVAAVRCERIRFELQGTRSERVFIETTVLSTGGGETVPSVLLTRYTQGDSLLVPGKVYLIAAYDDQGLSPAYNLVEWISIAPETAEKMASEARRIVLDRKKNKQKP